MAHSPSSLPPPAPWAIPASPAATQQPELVAPAPMGQPFTRPVHASQASERITRRSSLDGTEERTSRIGIHGSRSRSSSTQRRSSGSRAASGNPTRVPAAARADTSCSSEDPSQHLLALLRQVDGGTKNTPDVDFILREAVPAIGEENEGINGHLRCSICLGLFVRPYTVAQGCGHTYCQTCLLQTFIAAAERKQSQARQEDQAFIDQEQHFMLAAPSFGTDSWGDSERLPDVPIPPMGESPSVSTTSVLQSSEGGVHSLFPGWLRTLVSLTIPCPTCRAPLALTDLVPAPAIVNHMLDSLRVLCPYRDKGCASTPERSELLAHMATCPHAPEQPTPRAQVPDAPICPDCSEPLDGTPLSRHRRRLCVEAEVACPLCHYTGLPRRILPTHLANDCVAAPVQCSRAKFGCLWEGKRILCPEGLSTLTPAQINEHVLASRPPKHDSHDHRLQDSATHASEQHASYNPETGLSASPSQTRAGPDDPAALCPAPDSCTSQLDIHVCPLAPLDGWLRARQNEMDEVRAENALLRSSLSQVQNTLARLEVASDRHAAALAPFLPSPAVRAPSLAQSTAPATQTVSLASLVDDLLAPSTSIARARSEATDDSAVLSHRTGSAVLGRSPASSQQRVALPSSPSPEEPSAPVPVPILGNRASSAGYRSDPAPQREGTLSASAPAAVGTEVPPPPPPPPPPAPPSTQWGTWTGTEVVWPPAESAPPLSANSTTQPDPAPRDLGQEMAQLHSAIEALTGRLTLGDARTDQVLRLAQGTNAETARLVEDTAALGRILGPLHMQMHQLMMQTQRPYAPMYMQRPSGVDTGPSPPGGPGPGPAGPVPLGPPVPAMGPSVGPGTVLPPGGAVQFRRWTLLDGTKL